MNLPTLAEEEGGYGGGPELQGFPKEHVMGEHRNSFWSRAHPASSLIPLGAHPLGNSHKMGWEPGG